VGYPLPFRRRGTGRFFRRLGFGCQTIRFGFCSRLNRFRHFRGFGFGLGFSFDFGGSLFRFGLGFSFDFGGSLFGFGLDFFFGGRFGGLSGRGEQNILGQRFGGFLGVCLKRLFLGHLCFDPRFLPPSNDRRLYAFPFHFARLFAAHIRFYLRDRLFVQRTHVAAHHDADIAHFLEKRLVLQIQFSGKFIYSDLRHPSPLPFVKNPVHLKSFHN
jgi:hypothetical protein